MKFSRAFCSKKNFACNGIADIECTILVKLVGRFDFVIVYDVDNIRNFYRVK